MKKYIRNVTIEVRIDSELAEHLAEMFGDDENKIEEFFETMSNEDLISNYDVDYDEYGFLGY